MKLLAISALVNALAATGLGMFVYFRDPAAARKLIYGLYCLSIAFWSVFTAGGNWRNRKILRAEPVAPGHGGRLSSHPCPYFHHTVTFLILVVRGMPER